MGLHSLLFLPRYFLTDATENLIGSGLSFSKVLTFIAETYENYYVCLWLSFDFFTIMLLALLLPSNKRWGRIVRLLAPILFIFLLFFNIYYEGSIIMYGAQPYLSNDYVLIRDVIPILWSQFEMNWNNSLVLSLIGLIFIFIVFFIIFKLLFYLKDKIQPNFVPPLFVLLSGIFALATIGSDKGKTAKNYSLLSRPAVPDSTLVDLDYYNDASYSKIDFPKILKSFQLKEPQINLIKSQQNKYKEFQKYSLKTKPNIYLIFIEGYGALASASPMLRADYKKYTQPLYDQLKKAEWHVASQYSISPIVGGRSWLGFTTFFSGLKIDNQILYSNLINYNYTYPHFGRFLKKQGYDFYRLQTIQDKTGKSNAVLAPTQRFYDYDAWHTYKDFPYKGYKFDPFSGIPDQYALYHFEDNLKQQDNNPFICFFITMNSHTPFYKPPPVLSDWKMLDTIKVSPYGEPYPKAMGQGPGSLRYGRCMKYQLEFLTDFILKRGDANSLFILLGDHQPLVYDHHNEIESYKFAVPIHIISKDSLFVKSLSGAGFEQDFYIPRDGQVPLKHEGLYSLLVQQLIRQYGEDAATLPEYYPNGLQVD